MAADTKDRAQVARPVTRDSALAAWPQMIAAVPDAEFDADGSSILADIIMASNVDDLNATSGSLPDAEDMVGKRVLIQAIGKMPSTLEGKDWYLIVDYTDTTTGEARKFQTSANSVLAKLVWLHLSGVLPAEVQITRAEKATRKGFFPLDVFVHQVSNRK